MCSLNTTYFPKKIINMFVLKNDQYVGRTTHGKNTFADPTQNVLSDIFIIYFSVLGHNMKCQHQHYLFDEIVLTT